VLLVFQVGAADPLIPARLRGRVAAAGYATDPNYASLLISVMGNRPCGRNMAQYDVQPAMVPA
jgi:hypothetical protein